MTDHVQREQDHLMLDRQMSRSMFISDTFPWHVTAHFLLSYTDKHKMRQNATLQFERSRFVIQHNTFNTKVDTPTSFIFLKHV